MAVLRIVPNIEMPDPAAARAFWCDVIGLETLMDQGWIQTHGSAAQARPQLSVASEGGSGTPVPAISVEVDDLDAAIKWAEQSPAAEYGSVEIRPVMMNPTG